MVALNPILELAWLIAGVGAALEHGDDDDLDGNAMIFRRGDRCEKKERGRDAREHVSIINEVMSEPPTRLWLWPNLLSLDAPIVAVLWQILFARCFHVPVDAVAAVLLAIAVWLIYVADRTLDAWKGERRSARHLFYARHWKQLLPVWLAVLGAAGWLAIERLPAELFERGVFLLAAVVVYLVLIHFGRRRFPKEAAVGVLFALGASLIAWGEVRTLADAAAICLFCGLCWINCLAIEKWEKWERWEQRDDGPRNWSPGVAALAVALMAGVLLYANRPVLGGAELASAFGLLLLGIARTRLSVNAMRVLADVALLSPALFISVMR